MKLPREWRWDFKQRGAEDVRRQVNASNFHPDKHRAASRWLYEELHNFSSAQRRGIIARGSRKRSVLGGSRPCLPRLRIARTGAVRESLLRQREIPETPGTAILSVLGAIKVGDYMKSDKLTVAVITGAALGLLVGYA